MQEPFDFDDHLYVGFPLRYTRSGAEVSILCKVRMLLAKTCLTTSHNYYLIFTYYHTHIHVCVYIYGVASKFGYGSARGDPDVWNGLDHLRFGMDRGYGSACGFRVWIGALYFDSQPYIMLCSNFGEKVTSVTFQLDCHNPEAWAGGGVSFAPWRSERPW